MAQEIKIPVSAKTDVAERGFGKVEEAAAGVAAATRNIGEAARSAAGDLKKLEEQARQLAAIKRTLASEGISLSGDELSRVASNYESVRRRGRGAQTMRDFDTLDDWRTGHAAAFTKRVHADNHRRLMMSRLLQGTSAAGSFGAGDDLPPGGGGGGGAGGGGLGGAGRMAMGLGRSMLALAGVGSVVAMAAQAVRSAASEAENVDASKRRLGDLGVDFYALRGESRRAGARYGVTAEASAGYMAQYVRQAGRLGPGDALNGGAASGLGTALGFSRSYGMDLGEGVSFFAGMRRQRVTNNDQQDRRLALLIADAIDKGGFVGAAEEVLQAVQQFTTQAVRSNFTSPNVSAFLEGLSSLMATGYAGMDAQGAAALIGQADAATRRGGAYGQAGLNFMYAALQRSSPGLHPLTGRALMESGLFGTTAETFYGNNPLSRYYQRNRLSRPGMNFQTNFDKMIPLLEQEYGKGVYLPEAVKNLFGLSSQSAAAALMEMRDQGTLGASERMLSQRGINLSSISGSGLQTISRIAGAKSSNDLEAIYGDLMRRRDIDRSVKEKLNTDVSRAARSGDFEAVRSAMIEAVGKSDQEKTVATETRDATKVIADALTMAGSPLLTALNAIRIAGEVVVRFLGKGAQYQMEVNGYARSAQMAKKALENGDPGLPTPEWRRMRTARPTGSYSERQSAAMQYFMGRGWSRAQAAGIVGNLAVESNLNPNGPRGDGGKARGIAQWHPDRWKNLETFARIRGLDPNSFEAQLAFVDHELRTTEAKAGGALGRTKTARDAARAVALHYERPKGAETGSADAIPSMGQRENIAGQVMDTPLPDGDPAGKSAAQRQSQVQVSFAPAQVTINDMRRAGIAPQTVTLKPVAKPKASGATASW